MRWSIVTIGLFNLFKSLTSTSNGLLRSYVPAEEASLDAARDSDGEEIGGPELAWEDQGLLDQQVSSPSLFPTSEWLALETLYKSTGGDKWKYFNKGNRWNFSSELRNPCYNRWEGILCSCNLSRPLTIYQMFYPYYGYYDNTTMPFKPNVVCSVVKLYLSRKGLSGQIPSQISDLGNLTNLHLKSNQITGSFPSGILRLSKLQRLLMYNNKMKGPLPDNVANFPFLRALTLHYNSFTSTIPSSWSSQLPSLKFLYLQKNKFTGSLPTSWSAMPSLQYLYLDSNSIEGHLPTAWSALQQLQVLLLYSNRIRGTLPESWSALTQLKYLFLNYNSLRGQLPPSYSTLQVVKQLYLSANVLTGALPQSWSALNNIQQLRLDSNNFTGTFPASWSTLSSLEILDVHSNILSGFPDPSIWIGLSALERLLLNSNSFSGPIPSTIGKVSSLQVLLLQNNFFSGIIPKSIFHLPKLETLSLAVNCLDIESFDYSDVCAARTLTNLVLDGIHSGRRCGNKKFLAHPSRALGLSDATYALPQDSKASTGGVPMPLCLLSLPRLTTLHASGAGLVGNLSLLNNAQLSPNLTDLVLSHNYLDGSIPLAIQQRTSWRRLDLSFNLLSGTLVPDISFSVNTTKLDVSNNRLSGAIPTGLLYQPNISILQGNVYTCPLFNSSVTLPVHDPYQTQYICGANDFSISVLVWGCAMTSCALIGLILAYYLQSPNDENRSVVSFCGFISSFIAANINYEQSPPTAVDVAPLNFTLRIQPLEASLSKIRLCTFTMAPIIAVLMLVYRLFKLPAFNYSAVTEQDAYLVSVTQLEGFTPAIIIAFFYLIIDLGCYSMLRLELKGIAVHDNHKNFSTERKTSTRNYAEWSNKILHYLLIFSINIVVVSIINGLYVAAYFAYSASIVRFISFLLSIFKLLWTRYGVSYLLSWKLSFASQSSATTTRSHYISYFTALVVANTVIIPSLSIILIAPQCARYVFEAPPPITASVSLCQFYSRVVINTAATPSACTERLAISGAYIAPFLYSNQCSYALLTGYASVFAYTFALVGCVIPAWLVLCSILVRRLSGNPNTWLFCLVADILPVQCLPVEHAELVWQSKTLAKLRKIFQPKKSSIREISVGVELAVISEIHPTEPRNEGVRVSSASISSGGVDDITVGTPMASDRDFKFRDPEVPVSSLAPTYPSLTVVRSDLFVVQINQVLCICVSFGLVFPPLMLLGTSALFIQSLFMQYTVRQFNCELDGIKASHINSIPLEKYRLAVEDGCQRFSVAFRQCLSIPFIAAFPILAFFLFEIVSIAYPYQIELTIILPVLFLVVSFGCWQLLLWKQSLCQRVAEWWPALNSNFQRAS